MHAVRRTCSGSSSARCSRATSAGRAQGADAGDPAPGTTARRTSRPAVLRGMTESPSPVADISGPRVLALLGDTITTRHHHQPGGRIKKDGPAGKYLAAHGVDERVQQYGAAPGQPRGHRPRIVSQRPAEQRPGAGGRGRGDPPPADGEELSSSTRQCGIRRRACRSSSSAARSTGRARPATGRPEGDVAAGRRARGHRRELRAHPPLEPGRHRHAAADAGRGAAHHG